MSIKYTNTEQIVPTDVANKLKTWNDLNPVHQITFNVIENLEGNKSKVRIKMPYGRNLFVQKLVFFLTEALSHSQPVNLTWENTSVKLTDGYNTSSIPLTVKNPVLNTGGRETKATGLDPKQPYSIDN